jgi:DNA-binding LacI/PurR family transcriptional regulator
LSRNITLRRIASEAGVSIATASRAIRQPDVVSDQTRARVLQLVEAYGYVPDAAAASFSSRRSGVVGLVVPTISNSIYAAFTEAVQACLQESGRKLLIASTGYSAEVEQDIIIKLVESRAEAVILTGYTRAAKLYDLLRRYEIPFVISWSTSPDPEVPSISFDNYAASFDAVERLLRLGHRRIALMCGVTAVNDRASQRLAAYRDAIERHGIAFDAALVFERPFEALEGAMALDQILDLAVPPSALFCANDILAMGALFACQRRRVRVPEDLSIVGFDDLPIAATTWPSLSTVRVPAGEMGRLVAGSVLSALDSGEAIRSQVIRTEFISRESVSRGHA